MNLSVEESICEQRISPPSHKAILAFWQAQPENIFRVEFDAGPECFACHEAPSGNDRLQRAHVVARSAGGDLDPENFVLLCGPCHHEAPMTAERDILISWIQNHEHWSDSWIRDTRELMVKYKIPEVALTDATFAGWMEFMRTSKLSFHPQSRRRDKVDMMLMMLREFLTRSNWKTPDVPLDRADDWI